MDPIGLAEADKNMGSTFLALDLEGVELRTSLPLLLKQLDLEYDVRDGLLVITSQESSEFRWRSSRWIPIRPSAIACWRSRCRVRRIRGSAGLRPGAQAGGVN